MDYKLVSKQTIIRLPSYLNYLKILTGPPNEYVSATMVANALGLNHVQVRKDLAVVGKGGKPKVGYVKSELIGEIEEFLGYNTKNNAIIMGTGNLGKALLSYPGFKNYGINICAALDDNPELAGETISGVKVYPLEDLPSVCKKHKVKIAILTVPEGKAQNACDRLVDAGITSILNYAQIHLLVPENVKVETENVAYSISCLVHHLNG